MKRVFLFIVAGIIMFGVASCGSKKKEESTETKKATTVAELIKTYGDKKFKNCDEAVAAGNEIFDFYFKTIEDAEVGNEKDLEELEELEGFIDEYVDNAEKFEEECPEKFDALAEKINKGYEEHAEKYTELYSYGAEEDYEEYEEEDLDASEE